MRCSFLFPLLLLFGLAAKAQLADTTAQVDLSEFIFSINKFKENKKNIAQPIQVIGRKEIEWAMPQTAAVLLEQSGNVFVQKSQMGGGSPVLRGFEASRVLLVIDGVRMNNAIYRTGHLQNAITVDNNMLERTEIMFGPASTLFGSDALGGVIVYTTKQPLTSPDKSPLVRANTMVRYSSAYNEKAGHVDFNIGLKKFASLTSLTYSKFGDLRQGGNRADAIGDLGLRREYVTRINGADSIVANNNPDIQKFSGYSQIDLLEKLLYRANDRITHTLNLQYSTSSDIPRYDRLTDVRNGKLRFAEWYYGPQERMMGAYQLSAERLAGFFNELKLGINHQLIEESRHQRERGKDLLESRVEKVNVTGYNLDLRKLMGNHELITGIDGQWNNVTSKANARNITTSELSPASTRYPDGGSTMSYAALYAQHLLKIIPGKLILNDGIRFSYVKQRARFNDTSFFAFPFSEASQRHFAWSGNLGLVFLPTPAWRFALNASTGFRAPNIDDVGKVFDSRAGSQLIVPNPELQPEYTYNADLNISRVIKDKVKLEASGFYTWFRNAIILDRFSFNGQDSLLFAGQMTEVVANQNKAKAYLAGASGAITVNLPRHLTFYATINYTYGRYFNATGEKVPMDHIPPMFGKLSIKHEPGKFNSEFFVLFNGWKRIRDYNPYGEDNQQYATPEGMPSWYTLNLRTGYRINRHLAIQAALENILDYNYRTFASGISAPGRNLVITLRGSL